MKVILLNPPFLPRFSRPQRSPAVTKSGTLYFPIWLAYGTAVLEKQGFTVFLIDAPASDMDLPGVLRRIGEIHPDLVVLDTSTPSIRNDLQVAEEIRRVLPDACLVLVGTHVSALAEETLRASIAPDAIARREYEQTILELALLVQNDPGAVQTRNGFDRVPGLSYRTGNRIVHNPDRPFIEEIDSLPWVSPVYKKHLNLRDYFNPNALYPMVTLITSRGCPFRCSFCVYPQVLTGRKYRFRSIGDVLDEMEYVIREFPEARSIFFEDDTLTANKKRCLAFADGILSRGFRIPWTANSRIELDLETMLRIQDAGCRQLCVGFESGDQHTLDGMKKGTRLERMHRFMEDARKAGLLIHGCFMIGFPGETRKSVLRTIDLAIRLKPDTVQFYPVMVYPGTEAYEDYQQRGWITATDYRQWLTPEGLHSCVVCNEALSGAELVRLCDQARRSFYLRPEYMAYKLTQILKKPSEIIRTAKAARTFFRYLVRGSGV